MVLIGCLLPSKQSQMSWLAAVTDSQSTSLTRLHTTNTTVHTTNTTVHTLKPECDVESVRWRHTLLAGYFSFSFVPEEVEYLYFCICCGAGLFSYQMWHHGAHHILHLFLQAPHEKNTPWLKERTSCSVHSPQYKQKPSLVARGWALTSNLLLYSAALSPMARQPVTVLLFLISLSLLHPPFRHTDCSVFIT